MHVKNVDNDHIPAFSFTLVAEFGAARSCNRRNQRRRSSAKYADMTKATDHASPFDRWIASTELHVSMEKPRPVSKFPVFLSIYN
jgi:hypothetical protein